MQCRYYEGLLGVPRLETTRTFPFAYLNTFSHLTHLIYFILNIKYGNEVAVRHSPPHIASHHINLHIINKKVIKKCMK